MVAEAGGEGTLPVAVALPLLLVILLGAVAVGAFQARAGLVSRVPFDRPPVLMSSRAAEVVAGLGYSIVGADTASGFVSDTGYIGWLKREDAAPERWQVLADGRPAAILFWWRSAPGTLVPSSPPGAGTGGEVSLSNPPRTTPGMISLQLDTTGRLAWLDVVPARVPDAAREGAAAPADWQGLFEAMGLEMDDFTSVAPRYTPDHFADERAAWEGGYPEDPQATLRIEAAAWEGRPISLRLFTPWDPLEPAASGPSTGAPAVVSAVIVTMVLGILAMLLIVVFGALYVAQRNVRSGRGDLRGARRLALAVSVGLGLAWLLGEHTYSPSDVNVFIEAMVFIGASAGLTWALYLAIEPFLRRYAPETLIGWARLIDGRLADPLVGRDILFGCVAGVLGRLLEVTPLGLGDRMSTAGTFIGLPFTSLPAALGSMIGGATVLVMAALGLTFLYGLSFLVMGRRRWVVYCVWLVLFGGVGFIPGIAINNSNPSATTLTSWLWVAGMALWLFVLFRLGILAYITASATSALLTNAVTTLDFSAWYAASAITGLVILFGVAAYAFTRCVAWRGGLAEALAGD
jgi:hypothetical protein